MSAFIKWWDRWTGDCSRTDEEFGVFPAKAGWNAALEAAAQLMLDRKVTASQFYADEILKLKEKQ